MNKKSQSPLYNIDDVCLLASKGEFILDSEKSRYMYRELGFDEDGKFAAFFDAIRKGGTHISVKEGMKSESGQYDCDDYKVWFDEENCCLDRTKRIGICIYVKFAIDEESGLVVVRLHLDGRY